MSDEPTDRVMTQLGRQLRGPALAGGLAAMPGLGTSYLLYGQVRALEAQVETLTRELETQRTARDVQEAETKQFWRVDWPAVVTSTSQVEDLRVDLAELEARVAACEAR